jgi:monooxygenase
MTEQVDFLIVGAGVSGIGVAHHLQAKHPGKSFVILDARDRIGGTWDLFRYPGVRSDSDFLTFGYSFKPWLDDRVLADGSAIRRYVEETAIEHGIIDKVRYRHRVLGADWSSADQRWTVEADDQSSGETRRFTTRWLISATGYYDYEGGHAPVFPGEDDFAGTVVHPQEWPEELEYAGKRVVVIGSGATAATIVPAMAETAAHVTMLQRTPTYMMSIPAIDKTFRRMRTVLGSRLAYRLRRERNMRFDLWFFKFCRRYPKLARKLIASSAAGALPKGYAVDTHFNPPYGPWDQRMCVLPDGDLFTAIGDGRASIVTGQIAGFTRDGIRMESGEEIQADIVVRATGLRMLPFGRMELRVDGEDVQFADTFVYKAMMLTGVPNFAFFFGYTNASWTLRVDLVGDHLGRIISLMDEHEYGACVPESPPAGDEPRPLFDFSAGYIQRALDQWPRQGTSDPWLMSMDYVHDRKQLLKGPVGDHVRFTSVRHADAGVSAGRSQP